MTLYNCIVLLVLTFVGLMVWWRRQELTKREKLEAAENAQALHATRDADLDPADDD